MAGGKPGTFLPTVDPFVVLISEPLVPVNGRLSLDDQGEKTKSNSPQPLNIRFFMVPPRWLLLSNHLKNQRCYHLVPLLVKK